jgi:sulfatase maturation enzyme AslB (radical SAM superfamily)
MRQENSKIIPASIDIDITNHCNQDCYYCESADFRANSLTAQSAADYHELLSKLATWRAHSPDSVGTLHTVCFSGGGEPTLFKGYEKLLEHSMKLGFQTSMITNGVNLEKLLTIDCKKLAWIGIDLDAGNETTYEKIRRTSGKSIFNKVLNNITQLVDRGVNIDIKILLNEYNSSEAELVDIFVLASKLGVRSVYFRPTVINGVPFDFRSCVDLINQLADTYKVSVKINLKKFEQRTYSKCHQMYQFLIFCPDGNMYTCCENKGNPIFSIGAWNKDDFRDLWLSDSHNSIYNKINTKLCPPCRSHNHNLAVQKIIDNPSMLDILYY